MHHESKGVSNTGEAGGTGSPNRPPSLPLNILDSLTVHHLVLEYVFN